MLTLICLQVLALGQLAQSAGQPPRMLRPSDVVATLKESLAGIAPDAQVEVVECSQTALRGRVEFPLTGAGRPPVSHPDSPFLWRGRVLLESGAEYSAWARVRVVVKCKVIRTLVDLPAGAVLKPEQMETVDALGSPFLKQKDKALSDYAGLCLRRALPALTNLSKELVDTPPLVRRGSRVEVEAISGKTRLMFEAEAHTNGRLGDRIQLVNLRSGKLFWGVVSGTGSIVIAVPR
jgi:flagella basal body P-ring formation protein FlgA